jgi:ABC-type bacteriocin/lantibiotic exporter with double-glycine peptidase domain
VSRIILPVPHIQQRAEGECLAACAAMVLSYLKFSATYEQLLKVLQVEWFGAPAPNIRYLKKLNLTVTHEAGDLTTLHNHLLQDRPCIAFVQTGDLAYWQEKVSHAVVVIGLDDDSVYLNDPEFAIAPMQVSRGNFDLAWLAQGEHYAVITQYP